MEPSKGTECEWIVSFVLHRLGCECQCLFVRSDRYEEMGIGRSEGHVGFVCSEAFFEERMGIDISSGCRG